MQREDKAIVLEWICNCLNLTFEERTELLEIGLMSLTSKSSITLIVISRVVGVLDAYKIDNSHATIIQSSVDQLRNLWKVLGDDDPDRVFRLGVLENEADRVFCLNVLEGEDLLNYNEARKDTWLVAVLENLQDPRKLDRFGYSLHYEKPKDREDVPLEMAGEYVMLATPNFALGGLLSQPDGDPTLVYSAKQYYGHIHKESTPRVALLGFKFPNHHLEG